jgi:hypothetical protein
LIGGDSLEVLFQDPAEELVDVATRFSQFDITVQALSEGVHTSTFGFTGNFCV